MYSLATMHSVTDRMNRQAHRQTPLACQSSC